MCHCHMRSWGQRYLEIYIISTHQEFMVSGGNKHRKWYIFRGGVELRLCFIY